VTDRDHQQRAGEGRSSTTAHPAAHPTAHPAHGHAPGGPAASSCDSGKTRPVPEAGAWALFLDFDGTLVPIVERPDEVAVTPRLRDVLGRLQPLLDGAVALVSGRSLADLDRLFAPLRLPAAGVHGLERRDARGAVHETAPPPELDELRKPFRAFAQHHPGIILEDKGRSLALHYRTAPGLAGDVQRLVEHLVDGHHPSLHVVEGAMVLEVKARIADKGAAISRFMAEEPFAGRRPVFIGDDITDEDGFAVINAMGGISIRVGCRPSAARRRLADVEAVFAWLTDLTHALTEPPLGSRP
jgi:trehalose 6-phosphate phosphatase